MPIDDQSALNQGMGLYSRNVEGMPPLPPGDNAPPAPPAEAAPLPAPAEPVVSPQELILGKFKSLEDVPPAYHALEGKLGEMGTTIAQQKQLLDQYQQMIPNQQPQQPSMPSYEEAVAELDQRLQSGDLDPIAYTREMAKVTRHYNAIEVQQAVMEAQNQTKEEMAQQSAVQQFRAEHPNFDKYVDPANPVAQRVFQKYSYFMKNADGTPDLFALYLAVEAEEAKRNVSTVAQVAHAKGKEETQKLAQGSVVANAVLAQPGATAKPVNPTQPRTQAERLRSAKNALDGVRGGPIS